jgi:predicted AlkP superfamily pyrophosphatase or phosphodiesterase
VRKYSPDYLLVHPMGMDYSGEKYGADSSQYRNQAIFQDMYLSGLITEWMALDYNILVTGDHGINADHLHGGTTPEQRDVPLYLIRPDMQGAGDTGKVISQLALAPTICTLLGIPIPETMKSPSIV